MLFAVARAADGQTEALRAISCLRGDVAELCHMGFRAQVSQDAPVNANLLRIDRGFVRSLGPLTVPLNGKLPRKIGCSAFALVSSRPARRSFGLRTGHSLNRPRRFSSPECFRPRCSLGPAFRWLVARSTVAGRSWSLLECGAFSRNSTLKLWPGTAELPAGACGHSVLG